MLGNCKRRQKCLSNPKETRKTIKKRTALSIEKIRGLSEAQENNEIQPKSGAGLSG